MLARKLAKNRIGYNLLDNAFTDIEDFDVSQKLSDDLDIARLHGRLDEYAKLCCPVIQKLGVTYHWSLMQVEYATDIIFKRQSDLKLLYEAITRTAIHAVKPDSHLPRT
jgi:hypothetical protein